jgi:formate hydrogenlyase transcriptional activator
MTRDAQKSITKKTENTCSRQELEELVQFETLISDLAARFVNLPVSQVDNEIEHGLELVANFLGADRGGISQFSEDKKTLTLTHSYVRDDIPPFPHQSLELDNTFLWYKQTLQTKGMVVFEELPDDLPAEAVFERQHCIEHGIKSNIALPLWTGKDEPDGVIGFVFIRKKKAWAPQCIQRVQFIGKVFASILNHRQAEEALEKHIQKSNNSMNAWKRKIFT